MAVLVEGISVVVRRASIDAKYPGGWDEFAKCAPNDTFCADRALARIGFMHPTDVEEYINELEALGLVYRENEKAIDVVVIDQNGGPMVMCDWIENGHIEPVPGQRVAACRIIGDTENTMASPESWSYEGSLSQNYGLVPSGMENKSLQFLRREEGTDVFLNVVTGEEVFVGRTSQE